MIVHPCKLDSRPDISITFTYEEAVILACLVGNIGGWQGHSVHTLYHKVREYYHLNDFLIADIIGFEGRCVTINPKILQELD